MTVTSAKNARKILTVGGLIILAATLLSQAAAILTTVLSSSPAYSTSSVLDILYILRTVFDSVIFAAGAALILIFVHLRDKKGLLFAYLTAMLILLLDYGISFVIDFAYGLVYGFELLTLLYLFLNYAARAIIYSVIILFAVRVCAKSSDGELPVPFISLTHPLSRMLGIAFLARITPYIIFEIYSNITGIIEYGFDMTGSDILAIISAYAEILIDGALIYCIMYLLLMLYTGLSEKAKQQI